MQDLPTAGYLIKPITREKVSQLVHDYFVNYLINSAWFFLAAQRASRQKWAYWTTSFFITVAVGLCILVRYSPLGSVLISRVL